MAALLVLLLLLAVSSTAFTTTDVYYVTADHADQSCPPHQICHNLSYYISQPDYYFTSYTTIIFLEGEHSFDREDLVHVSNVHNLTFKGLGQWQVAGAEKTVMQSTVSINCTRGRGGFYFVTSHNITVEGLTVFNCGGLDNTAVFMFSKVKTLFFLKNSIQHMTGFGLYVHNCDNAIITNCSYYHSVLCNIIEAFGGGVGIVYDTQYSYAGYTLELSHSNMTKCCSSIGGGLLLLVQKGFGKLFFNHLNLLHNKAVWFGGLIAVALTGSGNASLMITDCVLFKGTANKGGGMFIYDQMQSTHMLFNHLSLLNNEASSYGGGIAAYFGGNGNAILVISNSVFSNGTAAAGGGISIDNNMQSTKILLNNLTLLSNEASYEGGGIATYLKGNGNVTLVISNSVFCNGTATLNADTIGGGMFILIAIKSANIIINNTEFVHNNGQLVSEMGVFFSSAKQTSINPDVTFSMINSTVYTEAYSIYGILLQGCCANVWITNTRMRFANVNIGLYTSNSDMYFKWNILKMVGCQFIGSSGVFSVFCSHFDFMVIIINCVFSNNTSDNDGRSVIIFQSNGNQNIIVHSCIISDNNMTGITLVQGNARLHGRNVIQNNRNTEGAGITVFTPASISIDGELLLINNTADKHGGGILLKKTILGMQKTMKASRYKHMLKLCTFEKFSNASFVIFSGNKASEGGSDMYGAILMGCYNKHHIPHVGHPNETSWYFDTPLMKYFHFSNTDRLSSMSSDPIMVCFCNNTTNLPDCSDRAHHIQTYPGLEINTLIATVGYYGGTSPGVVQVSAQHAKLVRYYGQNQTTNCFQLHIFLQNTSSTTALVDIRVRNVVQGLGVSIGVDILKCPIGFTQISGQCHCERFLDTSDVQCNLSAAPYMFLRSGNSWFAYINYTQCVTGANNCFFDYCNQSKVSFDIMAPDRQCLANRTGILCGQCLSNLSIMLGSNRCGTCSNWYLFLLPVFALAGIVLVAVLMFLNLSVSVGTINGLLFYANMVKLNEAFFFPNGSVPVVSQFISWLNLDLSIEVCLFNGLDGYWNTWLQFVFPAYLFLLMGGIIVGCRYSTWICRLCGSHAVPALATLFLMSYTKILLTVTNALSMSQLPCNDRILTVWSIDGNIEYGSGKHLILVVISCGLLLVVLAYPVLVVCAPLLERYSHKCIPKYCWIPVAKFEPLLDAYGRPYKNKFRFWTGVTLMVRLTVTVTFSFTSGILVAINASIIATVVVGILTFWSLTRGVYKNIYLNALEAFYIINIYLLSIIRLATASLGLKDDQIATIVSVCLSFVACLVTIAMHLWWNFDLKKIKRKLGFIDQPDYAVVPQVAADEDDDEDRPPPGSPPSIVYGTNRGEHQFVLEFPHPHDENESSSPVLLAREPLLFD